MQIPQDLYLVGNIFEHKNLYFRRYFSMYQGNIFIVHYIIDDQYKPNNLN